MSPTSRAHWIFGYGSLVWRPAFPHAERRPAWIEGFVRRFWQGSTDHRGVPGAPGRVVTLVPAPGERCWGMAYRVEADDLETVMARLDHREQGGYERHAVRLHMPHDGRRRTWDEASGLTYRATPDNPNYLGAAPLARIAEQVRASHGPSGPNVEYVLRLADALETLEAPDPHVFDLAARLRPRPGRGPGGDRSGDAASEG
jgi:cation transport regulator ChaC